MKIIAVLDVDEEKLVATGHSFEEEMNWVEQSGITLSSYKDITKCGDYDYQAFVWNKEKQEYEPVGYPTTTELLCKARYYERVKGNWLPAYYDAEDVIFKRRLATTVYGPWETIE